VTDSEPVNLEIMIEASPETVFEFFVDPRQMRTWIGEHVVLEPRVGGSFAVDIGENHVRGSYVDLQPPERVVFTWGWEGSDVVPPGSSTVTFVFEAREGGTLVRLIHSGLPTEEDHRHSQGWNHYLGRLTKVAIGVDPGPDPHAEGQAMMDEQPTGES
jgi:uncharacterized protein YndB with AHSA1/START domain